ncbi:MAG: alpha-N-arabinofuranosidase [Bacteroidaceae bacterium]|nr:alpha-N-arabinofuranosidase [Bacteroidaceae bacterium]
MKRIFISSMLLTLCLIAFGAERKSTVTVHTSEGTSVINRNIYGQFAEHLGTCIYGGLWVGEDSPIPNTNGYRNDVLTALKDLHIPVLRWPGGCFADDYHWMDGIGPRDKRPAKVNSTWGGTLEDNSFGTHEFLNLCELLECEPYVSMNIGSGTVRETSEWVEYMTADNGPMAELRHKNGRTNPWKVKFIGVGNESWGCGGSMTPEYYSNEYRRYATYCKNFSGNSLYKIASGASDYDYTWTETLMKNIGNRMDGLSLHYYTVLGWNGSKGKATTFTDDDYYWCLGKCLGIEPVIKKHIAIMDRYDAKNNIGLLVDEWGTWWDEEEGTTPGHLFQQNTMRDAFVAALSLNVFHKYSDRIKMCNIAQIANVLQSMILTNDDKMVLTPTYYVFKMYIPHQDATFLPSDIVCDEMQVPNERFQGGRNQEEEPTRTLPMLSATASRDAKGVLHLSLANVDLKQSQTVSVKLEETKAKSVSGTILTSKNIADHNTFKNPDTVKPEQFKGAKVNKKDASVITVTLPAKSIVTLEITTK